MGPISLISLCYASRITSQLLGDRVQAKGGRMTTYRNQSELRVLRIVSGIDHSTCRSYPLVAAFPGLGSHTWNTNFAECEHLDDVFRCPTAKREPKVNTRKGGRSPFLTTEGMARSLVDAGYFIATPAKLYLPSDLKYNRVAPQIPQRVCRTQP